ncbi:hypothetical protein T459_18952 [Capsicum annuum]|uniref:S-protein homolog n=1 Tax=Capsicum annuum TaxID=4072 RepID=A0A2G2Z084_CAPAN|nr:hypothetical protein T459_18952 [Capsicum annuum]
MALSIINIFYLLLLITHLDLSTAKKCFLYSKYQVYIINKLPPNSSQLQIHCALKNDDLGYHYPAINDDFNWSFCINFLLQLYTFVIFGGVQRMSLLLCLMTQSIVSIMG